MPKMTSGKVIECTAAAMAYASGGTGEGSHRITAFCREFGVSFSHTDEETAARRGSELYLNNQRLNNGRGERAFDVVVKAPIVKTGDIVEYIPVSLKAGDARDVSTDIPLMQSIVENGMPLWVYLLDGEAKSVEYADGVRVDIEPARNITMRRVNLTKVLQDFLSDWEIADGTDKVTFVRAHVVKAGNKVYTYPRLRVNWNKVPDTYFLDAVPVAFDATALMPNPWL